jgi:AbrB family looped-hinge helix DNA binding protein
MAIARSRVTAQGQISVPVEIRRRLSVGPGALLEWDERGDEIVVRRAGKYDSEDVHRALFAKTPTRRSLKELKAGVAKYVREKHAGG